MRDILGLVHALGSMGSVVRTEANEWKFFILLIGDVEEIVEVHSSWSKN